MKRVLNSPQSEQLFLELYQEMEAGHDRLVQFANARPERFDGIIPRELRLFRLRLRLAIGLKVSFDTRYAMVKDEQTSGTYVQIVKCNEAWFAYEAMIKLAAIANWKKARVNTPVDLFEESVFRGFELDPILNLFHEAIQSDIYQNAKIAKDLERYILFMLSKLESRPLKTILENTIVRVREKEKLSATDMLALIYATRNLFVHQGESARSGTKYYKTKITLLKHLYDFIILFLLKVNTAAFEKYWQEKGT